MIDYIIHRGGDVNGRSEHGESPLRVSIGRLHFSLDPDFGGHSRKMSAIECYRRLVESGTKWNLATKDEMTWLRKSFHQMDGREVFDLIKFSKQHSMCSDEVFVKLLNTPTLRVKLQDRHQALSSDCANDPPAEFIRGYNQGRRI